MNEGRELHSLSIVSKVKAFYQALSVLADGSSYQVSPSPEALFIVSRAT